MNITYFNVLSKIFSRLFPFRGFLVFDFHVFAAISESRGLHASFAILLFFKPELGWVEVEVEGVEGTAFFRAVKAFVIVEGALLTVGAGTRGIAIFGRGEKSGTKFIFIKSSTLGTSPSRPLNGSSSDGWRS